MKYSLNVLQSFSKDVPSCERELRDLFDDLGLEVKKFTEEQDDSIITLELLANRGDHYCYEGVAREVAARFKGELNLKTPRSLEIGVPPRDIKIETNLCYSYALTELEVIAPLNVSLGELSDKALSAMETLSDNVLIDVTNLVNYEIGQPSHAFDKDKVSGDVVIRLSRKGEEFWPLFEEKKREVPEGVLVIADDKKVLAIAGVIGCEDSKVDENTKAVLLETAAFDPVAVRKGGRAVGVHTDSCARFERGSDQTRVELAANLVTEYLEEKGVVKVVSPLGLVINQPVKDVVIDVDLDDLRSFFAKDFSRKEIVEILVGYGIEEVSSMKFKIPPYRIWDIKNYMDLYEEVARNIGYNEFPEALPPVGIGSVPSDTDKAMGLTNNVLVSNGFYEVFTDGFYGRKVKQKLGIDENHVLWDHVETINSIDAEYSLLKNNCLAQALDGISLNQRFKERDVKIFEWTRTFHPDSTALNKICKERDVLWGAVSGVVMPGRWDGVHASADVFYLKGLVEEIAFVNQIDLEVLEADEKHPLYQFLHPYKQFSLKYNGKIVGIIGELHSGLLKPFELKNVTPSYFELDRSCLGEFSHRLPVEQPPKIPHITRDMSFIIPPQVKIREVINEISNGAPDFVLKVEIKDRFLPKKEINSVVTMSIIMDGEKQLTSDEMNQALKNCISRVIRKFADEGVKLR